MIGKVSQIRAMVICMGSLDLFSITLWVKTSGVGSHEKSGHHQTFAASLGSMFIHEHRVQFYETDLMGIVHHSNYLRFYEEARVAWAHHRGIIDYQKPESAAHFAVLGTRVHHLRPARFGDLLQIHVQARREGIRVIFEYRIECGAEVISLGETRHAPLGPDLKPIRLPVAMKSALEKELWTGTWLLNL